MYRDLGNTPPFLDLLPCVCGLRGLDLGCGEGHNTSLLAGHGAAMCAVEQTAAEFPVVADTRVAAYFFLIRGRKPRG